MNRFDRKRWEILAKRFKTLGHPVRMWIAAQLMDGEKCVHEFVDRVDLDFSTVSQHLSGLKAAGVVEADKRGKKIFYRLKYSCVRSFLRCVEVKRRSGAC